MKIKTPYILLLLLLVVLGVYYPSIFAQINSVDDRKMINMILFNDHFSLKSIFLPGVTGYYYRPLLWLSYIADKEIWGFLPTFMHLENILLHAANVVFVYFISRQILRHYEAPAEPLSLSAALLFALHPINTEPVNWISARTDLLAGTFILASTLLLLRALASNRLHLCALASLCFLLACFVKESAVFFFPATLLMIWHYGDTRDSSFVGSLRATLRSKFLFYFSFSFVVVAYFTFRRFAFARGDTGIATAAQGIAGQDSHILYTLKVILKVFGFYVKKLLLPLPLNFAIVQTSDFYIPLGAGMLLVCVYLIYRRELVADLFVMSACLIFPTFFVVLGRMAWTPIAERYLYIPSASFSIGITIVTYFLLKRYNMQKLLTFFAITILTASAYATVNRNIVWQDNLTLFQDTIQKSPDYPPVKNELAIALKEHGRVDEGNRLFLNNASRNNARGKEFFDLNRANVMAEEGNYEGAKELLLDRLNPSSEAYSSLLLKLVDINNKLMKRTADKSKKVLLRQELIGYYTQLRKLTGDPYYHYKLGQHYLWSGNNNEARLCFIKAFEAAPKDAFYKASAKKMAEKLVQ